MFFLNAVIAIIVPAILCYPVVKDIWNDERIRRMEALGWKVIKLSY